MHSCHGVLSFWYILSVSLVDFTMIILSQRSLFLISSLWQHASSIRINKLFQLLYYFLQIPGSGLKTISWSKNWPNCINIWLFLWQVLLAPSFNWCRFRLSVRAKGSFIFKFFIFRPLLSLCTPLSLKLPFPIIKSHEKELKISWKTIWVFSREHSSERSVTCSPSGMGKVVAGSINSSVPKSKDRKCHLFIGVPSIHKAFCKMFKLLALPTTFKNEG